MKSAKDLITIPRLRFLVQMAFTSFCIYSGYLFYHFYQWAIGKSETFVSRPPSVEGFLPISALLGLKRFVLTGKYDEIHPAGLTILLSALAIALLLRKGFCGWICPVGFVSNLVEKGSRKLKILFRFPGWLDYSLLSVKYFVLAFFLYIILWQMNLKAVEAFMHSPYNIIVDGKMLQFFMAPSNLTLAILSIILLVSIFYRNFWCRYLCPYGGLLGLLASLSPSRVKRVEKLCVHCKKCDKVCPASIHVSNKRLVRSPECVGCMECVAECPQAGCLTLSVAGKQGMPILAFPVAVLAVFFLFWGVAVLSGHWHTSVSREMAAQIYPMSKIFGHP